MNLLVCADPGARSHTLAGWILGTLSRSVFEPGIVFSQNFDKVHDDFGNTRAKKHTGVKIRIRPGYAKLSTHLYLFLIKNVYTQIPNFSRNQFDLETATKVSEAAKYWFGHDQQIDNKIYDYVINFEDTYNLDLMIDLYYQIWKKYPEKNTIEILDQTNDLNNPVLDKNHACMVSAMVLEKENQLGLKEDQRFWSFPDLYQTVPESQLYDTILSHITPENYGVDLNKL